MRQAAASPKRSKALGSDLDFLDRQGKREKIEI